MEALPRMDLDLLGRRMLVSSVDPGLRIKETKEVYEGVTELTPTESESPLSGYGKTVSHVVISLKTVQGTKQPSIYEAILEEKIAVGDVIYVEHQTGAVRCAAGWPIGYVSYAPSFDLESDAYVPLPKSKVHKRKELVQDVTLGDLDAANAQDIVTDKLRREVNKVVKGYVDQGVAKVVPGVVFIDDACTCSTSMLHYLNRVASGPDRHSCNEPRRLPLDLLDRYMLVKTEAYTREQVGKVIQLRANVEGLRLGPGVLDRLAAGAKSRRCDLPCSF
ncbi:TIP49 C-terminus-domain-containing protein [Mycena galericulata]|nr:TIP49 C-terminus-domain-containing protein [Mycena galericulata]